LDPYLLSGVAAHVRDVDLERSTKEIADLSHLVFSKQAESLEDSRFLNRRNVHEVDVRLFPARPMVIASTKEEMRDVDSALESAVPVWTLCYPFIRNGVDTRHENVLTIGVSRGLKYKNAPYLRRHDDLHGTLAVDGPRDGLDRVMLIELSYEVILSLAYNLLHGYAGGVRVER
jgi:hypothetical protein